MRALSIAVQRHEFVLGGSVPVPGGRPSELDRPASSVPDGGLVPPTPLDVWPVPNSPHVLSCIHDSCPTRGDMNEPPGFIPTTAISVASRYR